MSDLRSKVIRLAHSNPELRPHLLPLLEEGRTAADEMGKAELELKAIVQKYKKYERNDRDSPPKDGQPWSVRAGMLEMIEDQTFGPRKFKLGLKIGTKFAEPKGYSYPSSEGWREAREERAKVVNPLLAEAKKVLGSIPGGYLDKFEGTAYTVIGWVAK